MFDKRYTMLSIKHAGLYVSALQNLTCTDTESEALTDGNNAIYQNIMDSLISTVGMGIICGSVELVILENADICIHALLQKALARQIQRSCCIISLIFLDNLLISTLSQFFLRAVEKEPLITFGKDSGVESEEKPSRIPLPNPLQQHQLLQAPHPSPPGG